MKKLPQKIINLRKRVDILDRAIIDKIAQRLGVVKKINALKKKYDYPLYDAARETTIRDRRQRVAKKLGLAPKFLDQIFEVIIKEGKSENLF